MYLEQVQEIRPCLSDPVSNPQRAWTPHSLHYPLLLLQPLFFIEKSSFCLILGNRQLLHLAQETRRL
jgi:hypothetical protein